MLNARYVPSLNCTGYGRWATQKDKLFHCYTVVGNKENLQLSKVAISNPGHGVRVFFNGNGNKNLMNLPEDG